MSNVGESKTTKKPSNTSSANPKSSASYVMQPMPHSQHRANVSQNYHKNTVEPTYTRPSKTKMTRAEHQINNYEEVSGVGSYTGRLK
jgi:hypothetical protein